ncbi:MAG: hypothetical protein HY574_14320 [candidate division NC10 bacterium]|nr:hypothetical protein [candidate division NC10 bacterium]
MMRRISGLLILALISFGTGCARLSAQEPMAFWGGSMGRATVPSPWANMAASRPLSGGGTVGVAGGLFLDEFEKRWTQ